jgi:hypothetical protein
MGSNRKESVDLVRDSPSMNWVPRSRARWSEDPNAEDKTAKDPACG